MTRREFASPYLSDRAGTIIGITCAACGLSRQYEADGLLQRLGDICLPDLPQRIARAEGCTRPPRLSDWENGCQARLNQPAK